VDRIKLLNLDTILDSKDQGETERDRERKLQ